MGEDFVYTTLKDEKVDVYSKRIGWFRNNAIGLIFAIGFLHLAVSIALLLYTLYIYFYNGHVSILLLLVLMTWMMGAFVIMLLGCISKSVSKRLLRSLDKNGHK